MAITYDKSNKQWTFEKEALKQLKPVNYPEKRYMNVTWDNVRIDRNRYEKRNIKASVSTKSDSSANSSFEIPLESAGMNYGDRLRGHLENNLGKTVAYSDAVQSTANGFIKQQPQIESDISTARTNEKINNEIIIPYNQETQELNDKIPKAQSIVTTTKGGDYLQQRKALEELNINGLTDQFKNFYLNEKLENWDSKLGAKPPYGTFDAVYYSGQNPNVKAVYDQAVKDDDVDIVNRYGSTNYYLWHYTTQGKAAGLRGNAPEKTSAATEYLEKKPTDKDLQDVRNLQLGVDTQTQAERILNIPQVAEQWDLAKRDDPYWRKLGKEYFLDVNKADEFATLFRLSNRPEDKQVSLDYNINAGYGITQLEDALNEAVGEKATVDVKKFGALAQDVLKETINEMKQAKAKEEMLDLFRGFSGFSEVMDINSQLSNSILGDTGVGGILSFTSAGKAEESLEKSLQGITGIGNNATYNWQQWFDTELKKRYEEDLELGYTTAEAEDKIKIEADFARQFVDDYLIPRFDTSRSMDEFVEYLDIRQEEQNPFQTQDMVNAVNLVADLRAQRYLDDIKTKSDRYFDSEFYFNPVGDKARDTAYADQAKTVAEDWEAAKAGDEYWAQQAYRFGVNVNDKDAFARMHFQIKGQGRGYDAAEDILNAGKVQDEIYNNILPALKEEALKQGSIFGQFITPEEFADEMLKGLDPSDKSTWDEVLQRYGLTDFKGTVEELKEYIVETLRTGSAQKIREEIKFLNEKRQRPTQEVLGLTYIERPEDYKDEQAKADTELYKVFQTAGYQGTEDEFYENFFPDLERSEQTLLTKAGSDDALESYGLDLSDPFASLGTIESFFDDTPVTEEGTDKKEASFFSLNLDDEDEDYKSQTGQKILGEFTSMFKGL